MGQGADVSQQDLQTGARADRWMSQGVSAQFLGKAVGGHALENQPIHASQGIHF